MAGPFYLLLRWLYLSDFVRLNDKKKHTINKKLKELPFIYKLFIVVVFTYRRGRIIFFLLFVLRLFSRRLQKQVLQKISCLNCLPEFFCGAESSINALGVAHISSQDSFSIFYTATAWSVRTQTGKKYLNVEVQ